MAFILKIVVIVFTAEIVIYALSLLIDGWGDLGRLPETVIRVLVVSFGVYFLFVWPRREVANDEAMDEVETASSEAEVAADEEDANQWPNIDALTRTSNERGLTISILELMALADRYGHKLSIGMIKVDGSENLKKSVADDAMINMAGLMTESIRMPDRIGRFKDDVFMVLLPESDLEGAGIVAGRLRENLQQGEAEDYHDKLSVWLGMTEFKRGEDLQSLLDRVEQAVDQSRDEENGICIKAV